MDHRIINDVYAEIGDRLIKEEESLRRIRESGVTIVYLSSTHKKCMGGNLVFGQCEKIQDKYKWGIPCDFTITIFEPNVAAFQFNERQMRALIHHELLHIGIDIDDKGAERYSIVPHDLEDFRLILATYGLDWDKYQGESENVSDGGAGGAAAGAV